MPDQREREISRELHRILGLDDKSRYVVMTGVVKSVEGDNSCTVVLTNDDPEALTPQVTISVNLENTTGMYGVPAVDADCLVLEVDGPKGKLELLRASKYDEIHVIQGAAIFVMKNGKFSIKNDGQDFKTVMDTFFDHVGQITVPTPSGTSGPPVNLTDLTSDKTNFDQLFF